MTWRDALLVAILAPLASAAILQNAAQQKTEP